MANPTDRSSLRGRDDTTSACESLLATERRRIQIAVFPAMFLPSLGALLYFGPLAGTRVGWGGFAATKGSTLLWPVIALLAIERRTVRLGPLQTAKHIRAIPLGVVSGLAICAAMIGVFQWSILGDFVRVHRDAVGAKLRALGLVTVSRYVLFGAAMSLFHSLLEEYFWRWYVFGRLSVIMRLWPAYIVAALTFAGHHYVVLSCYFPAWATVLFGTCVGIGGGFWCWLYRRQGTLVGCWLSHLLVDVALVYIGYQLVFR